MNFYAKVHRVSVISNSYVSKMRHFTLFHTGIFLFRQVIVGITQPYRRGNCPAILIYRTVITVIYIVVTHSLDYFIVQSYLPIMVMNVVACFLDEKPVFTGSP